MIGIGIGTTRHYIYSQGGASGIYWTTEMTAYWGDTMVALWNTTFDTEI